VNSILEQAGVMEDTIRYAVVIEKAEHNYSAYVPDLPGCVATGDTVAETLRSIGEAIDFHLEGIQADGEAIPLPTTRAAYVSSYFASIGRKGGKARAARMTPAQRSASARRAGRIGGKVGGRGRKKAKPG
jgi:predicted RNase H-like HicB family nuclease